MSLQRADSTEKSPDEEKASIDAHDSGCSQGRDDHSPALGHTTPKMTRKPTLPYAVADEPLSPVGNHWSNVRTSWWREPFPSFV